MTAGTPRPVDELVAATKVLVGAGVMSPTGHINASARTGDERMLLTSLGLVHELTPETFATVTFDGEVVDGHLDASTREIVGMHAAVYRCRAATQSVVHTHSPHLTAFALANQPLACRYEALLRRGQRSAVPVVPWAPRGSAAFTEGVGRAVERHAASWAVLLGNHGVLVFGSSPMAAAKLLVTLEEAAAAELRAIALGGARDLPSGALADG
ncbi:MAG TPA: class II aldolase/adducin family protein [Acidimicrobiales bacterium]|nr:class II aldolase/adducin family protein [Acidimicrobiales bacterium]